MGFGPIDRPKELVLSELATTFARLFTRGGNRVGAILFDNEIESTIPPRAVATRCSRSRATCCDRCLPRHRDRARWLLDTALGMIRRRSLVVLMSDFISEPGWERPLLQLTERHEVVAIRLVDRANSRCPTPA